MGEVYLGEAEGAANFTKRVAIKRVLPHLAENEGFVTKFIDEANLMVQLHHGNIVPVLELAEEDGELWLAMEYVPGRDLKAVIHRLRRDKIQMPPDLALWLVTEMCAGLDYAHQKVGDDGHPLGIVHRDVSPGNVVLGAGGEVKLVDFGIARARGGVHQSVSGALQGKFVYMSPEQADGRALDARSDVYAAGLVLYELLCGIRPFEGESETETLRLVRQGKVEAPSGHRPGLEDTLDALVLRALAYDPEDRYQTAGAMRLALLHHLAVSASPADAATFARFLGDLFPEGVVPPMAPQPKSLDEALLLQLGALTPTGPSRESTHTVTGSGGVVHQSRPASEPAHGGHVTGSNTGQERIESATTPARETAQRPLIGRRFAMAAGLVLGITLTFWALTWESQGQRAVVSAAVSPDTIEGIVVEVDDVAMAPNARLQAGQTYKICAHAPGYKASCRRILLEAGLNKPLFQLSPRPTLVPKVVPLGIPYSVLLDQAPVDLPFPLTAGGDYLVCVNAKGYRAHPRCRRVSARDGINAPEFELIARLASADARVPDHPADAGVLETKQKGPGLIRRINTPRAVLTSIPVAEVWRGQKRIGVTPVPVPIGPGTLNYVLRAKGYADTHHAVGPNHRPGPVSISLRRPGFLTVRVEPAASEIRLDGERIATGVLNRHPLSPGQHDLMVLFYRDGRVQGRYGPVKVNLEAGKESRLPPIQVPMNDARAKD